MRTSRSPTTVMTANGEVRTNEEATVYVKQLDLFVKVLLLQETPAVLSLVKLCEEHGCKYHWKSGQNLHLVKNGKRIDCNISNYVPFVLESQRPLAQLRLHLLRHHLHQRSLPTVIQYRKTEMWRRQYQKEGKVRVESFLETRCMIPRKPKTKIKISKEVRRGTSHELLDWPQEFRWKCG